MRRLSAISVVSAVERRSSAAQARRAAVNAADAPAEAGVYEIIKHGGLVLGYSLQLTLLATLLLLGLRALPWTDPDSPTHKLNPWATAYIIYPFFVVIYGMHFSLARCHSKYSFAEAYIPKNVTRSAVITASKVGPAWVMLLAGLVSLGVDVKFYSLDLLCGFGFFVTMVIVCKRPVGRFCREHFL